MFVHTGALQPRRWTAACVALIVLHIAAPTIADRALSSGSDSSGSPDLTPSANASCTPYLPAPYTSFDDLCAHYQNMTKKQLHAIFDSTKPPAPSDPFPLKGCVLGCLPGAGVIAANIRAVGFNQGWSGKCFARDVDPATGTPSTLTNVFGPGFYDPSKPQANRVGGDVQMTATVYYKPESIADGKPVWTFDYEDSKGIPAPTLDAWIDASSVRDEARQLAPGFVIGKMFLVGSEEGAVELPVMFLLAQACGPQQTVPYEPQLRLYPQL